jgi:HEAT repeat protein
MEERFAALWAVMYVPADLYETPTEDFVYDCVRVEEPAIRGNAVILVGKLARIGNARAMGLLRELAQDADEIVRTNATINLRAIETKEPHA